MPEWAVGDNRRAILLAPGDDLVLDRPFLEIVEDLVARDVAWTGDMKRLIEIWNVEVADAPCEDLARPDELLEARERLLSGMPPRQCSR